MSSSVPFSSEPPSKEDELKRLLALETAGRYIGPMPVDDFLNEFLPQGLDSCPTVPPDAFATVHGASPEIAMYPHFLESIEQFAPGMEFVDTHNHACAVGDFSLKPDVSVYAEGSRAAKVTTDFARMETWLEFKANTNDDPFVDYDINNLPEFSAERDGYLASFEFENDTVLAQQVRGQLTAYALAHLGSQFRNFGFSVLIMGKHARLIRWERAGAVVTRRFDYSKNPHILAEFFWRFAHLSAQERGIDTSVNPASSLSSSAERRIREGLRLKPETPLFEYQVPNGDGSRAYFGPRPPCPSLSLIGRSTRALPVYELDNEKCVYLKDTWRIDADDIGYRTATQTLVTEDWSCAREAITGHIHYRMVLGVVGRKLSTFRSTKELVQAVLDALTAHWKAYDGAKILHRDISSGKIILTDDGRGLLIDWDLSKSLEELKRRRRDRTGTWQFMSAALLQDPEKRHELQDDLESFLHVLAWSTVRYVPNQLTPDDRRDYLFMFDENRYSNGQTFGGKMKASLLRGNDYVGDFKLKHSTPLIDLLQSLSDVFVARYGRDPNQKERTIYKNLLQNADDRRIYEHYTLSIHQERLRCLTTSEWFISTFQQFLASAGWPDNDGSISNCVSSSEGIVTRRQQKLNKSRMESRESRHEASYYPSQSSHSSKRARSPSLAATEGRGKRPRGNTSTS